MRILPVIDLSDGPSGDTGFATLEQIAHDMVADTEWMPPLIAKVVKALYRNAAERAGQLGESADAIFHSFLVNVDPAAMEAYLQWEYGLVAQLERDGTHGFGVLT